MANSLCSYFPSTLVPRILVEASRHPPKPADNIFIAVTLLSALFEQKSALAERIGRMVNITPAALAFMKMETMIWAEDESKAGAENPVRNFLTEIKPRLIKLADVIEDDVRETPSHRAHCQSIAQTAIAFIGQVEQSGAPTKNPFNSPYRANPFVALNAAAEMLCYFDDALRVKMDRAFSAPGVHQPLDDLPRFRLYVRTHFDVTVPPYEAGEARLHQACLSLAALSGTLRHYAADCRMHHDKTIPGPALQAIEIARDYIGAYAYDTPGSATQPAKSSATILSFDAAQQKTFSRQLGYHGA